MILNSLVAPFLDEACTFDGLHVNPAAPLCAGCYSQILNRASALAIATSFNRIMTSFARPILAFTVSAFNLAHNVLRLPTAMH